VKDFLLELRATDKVKERPKRKTDKEKNKQGASFFFFETQLITCLCLPFFLKKSYGNQYVELDNLNLRKYVPSSD
jgi:hypothetical protein